MYNDKIRVMALFANENNEKQRSIIWVPLVSQLPFWSNQNLNLSCWTPNPWAFIQYHALMAAQWSFWGFGKADSERGSINQVASKATSLSQGHPVTIPKVIPAFWVPVELSYLPGSFHISLKLASLIIIKKKIKIGPLSQCPFTLSHLNKPTHAF